MCFSLGLTGISEAWKTFVLYILYMLILIVDLAEAPKAQQSKSMLLIFQRGKQSPDILLKNLFLTDIKIYSAFYTYL